MTDGQITLSKGFDDPVDGAGQAFRVILDVLSRPGSIVAIDGPVETPEGLSKGAAAVLLTLADYATPVWLDPASETEASVAYVQFHAGAPLIAAADNAAFAVLSTGALGFSINDFNIGTPQYPDRSTTLIVEVSEFGTGPAIALSGPGIDGVTEFQVDGLPENFWSEMQKNHELFPLGLDVIFTTSERIAALPRSTRIEVK